MKCFRQLQLCLYLKLWLVEKCMRSLWISVHWIWSLKEEVPGPIIGWQSPLPGQMQTIGDPQTKFITEQTAMGLLTIMLHLKIWLTMVLYWFCIYNWRWLRRKWAIYRCNFGKSDSRRHDHGWRYLWRWRFGNRFCNWKYRLWIPKLDRRRNSSFNWFWLQFYNTIRS